MQKASPTSSIYNRRGFASLCEKEVKRKTIPLKIREKTKTKTKIKKFIIFVSVFPI
jgi:hypothetical protein